MAAMAPIRAPRRWREIALVLGLIVLALTLRLYHLTRESLWYDEAYGVWVADMDIASLRILWDWQIEFSLYYLLLHAWIRLLGQGEFALRAFGMLAGVAAILPMYVLGKDLFGQRVGFLGALLLAVNPYHVWYSQEVRMHSWAVLLTLLSLLTFWRAVNEGRWRWWLAHALLTGLSFHVHFYIGWVVLAQDVFYGLRLGWLRKRLFARETWLELRRWLLGQIIVLLLALPAVAIFLTRSLTNNDWGWLAERYRAPGWRDLLSLFSAYTTGTTFVGPSVLRWAILFVFLALAGWGVVVAYGHGRVHPAKLEALGYVLVALGLPVGLLFGLGQFATVWVARYLLLFLPTFLLLVALGLGKVRLPWLSTGLTLLLVAASLYAVSGIYRGQYKEDWRGAAAYISARVAANDLLVLMDEEIRVPFSYYYGSGSLRIEVSRFADGVALDKAAAEIQRKQRGGHLWLVVSHADSQGLEQRLQTVPGLRLVASPRFVGLKLLVYEWP
jgi:mannosyltransferase